MHHSGGAFHSIFEIVSSWGRRVKPPSPPKEGGAVRYTHQELRDATDNFATLLGEGGYARVYQGRLQSGEMVAVKKLKSQYPDVVERFLNEVTVLARLRHKNLVALYGYTVPGGDELSIVCELVPNGTVADHLYGNLSALTWETRINIATETAEGLQYLHALKPPIIHCDVKPANILLDSNFQVKIADFGISRIMQWDATHVSTLPEGTVGYRDPEYDRFFRLTPKSDVYSFGVVLLELISGRKAVDVEKPLDEIYLYGMVNYKKIEDFVDPNLGYDSNQYVTRKVNSVFNLAMKCLKPMAEMRPSMLDVVKELKAISPYCEERIDRVGPWGGDGGTFFDLKDISLRRIRICSAVCINSIQVEHERNGCLHWSPLWGGKHGSNLFEIVLEEGEYIALIEGFTGTFTGISAVVKSLTFISNIRKYGPFGEEYGTPFSLPRLGEVVGFHGSSSSTYINYLGFYVVST